eukprot:3451696-Amphidinium_carterae.1
MLLGSWFSARGVCGVCTGKMFLFRTWRAVVKQHVPLEAFTPTLVAAVTQPPPTSTRRSAVFKMYSTNNNNYIT